MHDDSAFFDWCAQMTNTASPRIQPLAVEASHRRFYRVHASEQDTSSWVAMNSPPTLEQNDQFVALAEILPNTTFLSQYPSNRSVARLCAND